MVEYMRRCAAGGVGLTDALGVRYGTEPDAIHPRVSWHRGAFCAKSCHDAYHDAA